MANGLSARRAFTLIELSIVLVIIGLIVGGVLVGQNLITTATLRAQITQIEKYNTAVNTFRTKYNGALPGDMAIADVVNFGFGPAGRAAPTYPGSFGRGNANGVIEGAYGGNSWFQDGETAWFWEDLSTANLIDGTFNTAGSVGARNVSQSQLGLYFPVAKAGAGTYVYVYSFDGLNYFGLVALTSIDVNGQASTDGEHAGWLPAQAFAIDSKLDDGIPNSGRVQSFFSPIGGNYTLSESWTTTTVDVTGRKSVCWLTDTNQYDTVYNTGVTTCGLSFQFQ